MSQIIEWAPFTVVPGTDERALLAASEAIQRDFLAKQPGFIRRELLRIDADHWADLVCWESHAAAAEAMKAVESSAVCRAYFALMVPPADPATAVTLLERVRTYAADAAAA
jgi:heme-degrading monooxygenase HmoA